ncbi:MAG: hypothetical protein HYX40_13280 [Sphingobacteriales bacterium]|nr:hypothetical protein [Sphingobacteriales bacterium]
MPEERKCQAELVEALMIVSTNAWQHFDGLSVTAMFFIFSNKKAKFGKSIFMANAMEQELHSYFTRLSDEEKKSFIKLLKNFLAKRKDDTPRPSLEEYTRELELADEEIEKGDFILHEDVIKYFSKK